MNVWILIGFCVAAILLVVMVVYCIQIHNSQTRMIEMVDEAINGTFDEKTYDESVISSFESRLKQWIIQSTKTAKELEQERNVIESTIADIAHQTKTPIANLTIYSELLLEQQLNPEAQDYAQMMKFQSEKLKFLIDALVKASRLETGVIKVCPSVHSVVDLVEETCKQTKNCAQLKSISIVINIEPGKAEFDLKWTKEALFNLIHNAVKYSPKNSTITITGVNYEMFYRIDVKDQGIGIKESDLTKIFERFYRAQETKEEEGVGLGLYLAREILWKEEGYLKAASEPGHGSTFSMFLKR